MEDQMLSLAEAEKRYTEAEQEAQKVARDLLKGIAERANVTWTEADDLRASELVVSIIEAVRCQRIVVLVDSYERAERERGDA